LNTFLNDQNNFSKKVKKKERRLIECKRAN